MSEKTSEQKAIKTIYSRILALTLGLKEPELRGFLVGTGLLIHDLWDENVLISANQQEQIIKNALRISNDPLLALRLGKSLAPNTHGTLGLLVCHSPDLKSALKSFAEFIPSWINIIHLTILESEDQLECQLSCELDAGDEIEKFILEALVNCVITTIEFIYGKTLMDAKLLWPYSLPEPSVRGYPFEVDIKANRAALIIPASLGTYANPIANLEGYEFALKQCNLLKNALPQSNKNISNYVCSLLLSNSPLNFSQKDAADALFVSNKTLERRLMKEGTSFKDIKQSVMQEIATNYTKDTDLSFSAIAHYLGYTDISNFRRAFKRWYGCTPSEFRSKHKGDNSEH